MSPSVAEIAPVVVYQFHILLLEISPDIWRRVLVRSDSSVADLHYTLQTVVGWDDLHLHRFAVHGKDYGVAKIGGIEFADDPREVALRDLRLRIKERFLYEYNFTDLWRHQLRLEQILPFDPTKNYPVCLAGARRAPPEYCYGPRDFMACRDEHTLGRIGRRLREILDNLKDPEEVIEDYRAEVRRLNDWLYLSAFDRKAVNQRLQQHAAGEDVWSRTL